MSFRELLSFEFQRLGLKTYVQMSDKSGINYQYLRDVLAGKKATFSDDIIIDACRKLNLSPDTTRKFLFAAARDRADGNAKDWWEGQIKEPGTEQPAPDEATKAIRDWLDKILTEAKDHPGFLPSQIIAEVEKMKLPPGAIPVAPRKRPIPIYSSIACNLDPNLPASGEKVDELFMDIYDDETTFGLVASGDSMFGAESWIRDGEYVLFKQVTECPSGEVGCFCVDGWAACVCKRFRREPTGEVALISDNSAYSPKIFSPGDETKIVCKGVMVGTFRRPKKK